MLSQAAVSTPQDQNLILIANIYLSMTQTVPNSGSERNIATFLAVHHPASSNPQQVLHAVKSAD